MIKSYIEHHETDETVIFFSNNPHIDIEEELFIWWEYESEPNWWHNLATTGSFHITWHGLPAGIVTQELNTFHIYPID